MGIGNPLQLEGNLALQNILIFTEKILSLGLFIVQRHTTTTKKRMYIYLAGSSVVPAHFFITHSFIHMGVVFRDKTMGLYFFNKVNS